MKEHPAARPARNVDEKNKKVRVLELFAGSRSIGKAAEELGMTVVSTDITPYDGIDLVANVLDLHADMLGYFDVVWASPPCTAFSVAAMGHHWAPNYTPKTEGAKLGMQLSQKTVQLVQELCPKYWFIENPRGMMRKMPWMQDMERTTVWYCQYGDHRAKPTDIWSNNIRSLMNPEGFEARTCYNGNMHCHHDKCPRGTSDYGKGTQGLRGNHERSKIPHELCLEILRSCK